MPHLEKQHFLLIGCDCFCFRFSGHGNVSKQTRGKSSTTTYNLSSQRSLGSGQAINCTYPPPDHSRFCGRQAPRIINFSTYPAGERRQRLRRRQSQSPGQSPGGDHDPKPETSSFKGRINFPTYPPITISAMGGRKVINLMNRPTGTITACLGQGGYFF